MGMLKPTVRQSKTYFCCMMYLVLACNVMRSSRLQLCATDSILEVASQRTHVFFFLSFCHLCVKRFLANLLFLIHLDLHHPLTLGHAIVGVFVVAVRTCSPIHRVNMCRAVTISCPSARGLCPLCRGPLAWGPNCAFDAEAKILALVPATARLNRAFAASRP